MVFAEDFMKTNMKKVFAAILSILEKLNPFFIVLTLAGLAFLYTPLKDYVQLPLLCLDCFFIIIFVFRLIVLPFKSYALSARIILDVLCFLPVFLPLPFLRVLRFARLANFSVLSATLRQLPAAHFFMEMKQESPFVEKRLFRLMFASSAVCVIGLFVLDWYADLFITAQILLLIGNPLILTGLLTAYAVLLTIMYIAGSSYSKDASRLQRLIESAENKHYEQGRDELDTLLKMTEIGLEDIDDCGLSEEDFSNLPDIGSGGIAELEREAQNETETLIDENDFCHLPDIGALGTEEVTEEGVWEDDALFTGLDELEEAEELEKLEKSGDALDPPEESAQEPVQTAAPAAEAAPAQESKPEVTALSAETRKGLLASATRFYNEEKNAASITETLIRQIAREVSEETIKQLTPTIISYIKDNL